MHLSAFFHTLILLSCRVMATTDTFYVNNIVRHQSPDERIAIIHIVLDGVSSLLNSEQLEAINTAFRTSYNEVYSGAGFELESIEVIEQIVHYKGRRFLRSTTKSAPQMEPTTSYLTLTSKLKGSFSGTYFGAMVDPAYRTLMQRFWERKACDGLLTRKNPPAKLERCLTIRQDVYLGRAEPIIGTGSSYQMEIIL